MSAKETVIDTRTLVVVPTYNELPNLARTVQGLLRAAPQVQALIVDDASPDGTGRLADELAAADPRVHVLHRAGKDGLGAAYLAGFAWALRRDYEAVVEMDADGSHRPEHLPEILAALRSADVVLGSRWVPGGATVDWAPSRRLLSRAGNRYARAALRVPLRDVTGGYRAYRRSVLTALPLASISSQGYCFQIDMVRRAVGAGFAVTEVPITFVERAHGTSKMSGRIVAEALVRLTAWGLAEHRRPARPAGPPRPRPVPAPAAAPGHRSTAAR